MDLSIVLRVTWRSVVLSNPLLLLLLVMLRLTLLSSPVTTEGLKVGWSFMRRMSVLLFSPPLQQEKILFFLDCSLFSFSVNVFFEGVEEETSGKKKKSSRRKNFI